MRISKHFKRSEFACKCGCGFSVVDVKLIDILEAVRVHFNSPVKVNSACRCIEHNKNEGGATASKHLQGLAADIVVIGVSPSEVQTFVSGYVGAEWAGIGAYNTFTHIDSRESPARWRIKL